MGQLTISMAIFNSYVELPEGILTSKHLFDMFNYIFESLVLTGSIIRENRALSFFDQQAWI